MKHNKRKYQKTHLTRPRKGAGRKRRRQREHVQRLIELGMPEEQVSKMNPREILTKLKYPVKVAQEFGG